MPTRKICRRSSVKVIIYCEPAALLLKLLYTAKVPDREIVNFYTACIRPILEYASTVFHYSLPKYLSDEMERVLISSTFGVIDITFERSIPGTKLKLSRLVVVSVGCMS